MNVKVVRVPAEMQWRATEGSSMNMLVFLSAGHPSVPQFGERRHGGETPFHHALLKGGLHLVLFLHSSLGKLYLQPLDSLSTVLSMELTTLGREGLTEEISSDQYIC